METIYIAIASYNEPYLELMIQNCLENSEHPERIYFGVWCHNNRMEKPNLDGYKNLSCIFAEYEEMLGLGLSRINALSFYDGQDYFLQIDAHTLFEKNWDTKIINKFKMLKEKYDKPVLSSYLPFWYMENNQIQKYANHIRAPWNPLFVDIEYGLKEGYPKLITKHFDWSGADNYHEHFLITGHFIFSEPSIITEVLPDPNIMFDGEEITIALRLWTRGYRIFIIDESIAWHLNKAEDQYYKSSSPPNNEHTREYEIYRAKAQLGRDRTKQILTGEVLGYWGSPSLEKLKEFESVVGVNFKDFYNEYSSDEIHIGTL